MHVHLDLPAKSSESSALCVQLRPHRAIEKRGLRLRIVLLLKSTISLERDR